MDNRKLRGKPDRSRVNLSEGYERRYWCRKFKCTQRELVILKHLTELTFGTQPASSVAVEQTLHWADTKLRTYRAAERAARKPRRK